MKRKLIILILLFHILNICVAQENKLSIDFKNYKARTLLQTSIDGHVMHSIDMINDENLILVGNWTTDNCDISSVYVSGSYAYAYDNNKKGSYVIDISTPTSSKLVTFFNNGFVRCIRDDYAYISKISGNKISEKLYIFDISSPATAEEIGVFNVNGPTFLSNYYTYIFCDGNLHVFDISSPANPVEVGNLELGHRIIYDIDLVGNYLYVCGTYFKTDSDLEDPSRAYLMIINVFSPKSPTKLSFTDLCAGEATCIKVVNDHAYVTWIWHWSGGAIPKGLTIIDVSDPYLPKRAGSINANCPYDLYFANNELYVCRADGVSIFDLTSPTSPSQVCFWKNPNFNDYIFNFDVMGNHIYVAGRRSGLYILSKSNTIGLEEKDDTIDQYRLEQNYPNPFNASTEIEYSIPLSQQISHVSINIYNSCGQLVKNLVNEPQGVGTYSVNWDGTDENGIYVTSGIYFYKIRTEKLNIVKKMLLLR